MHSKPGASRLTALIVLFLSASGLAAPGRFDEAFRGHGRPVVDRTGFGIDAATATWGARDACAALAALSVADVRVTIAALLPADVESGLPGYCRVVGTISRTIGFELRLPSEWNERLYFAGNGVFAGSTTDTSAALSRGYAAVSTDTGHTGDFFDASWALRNRPAEIDFGHRAVHLTTLAAKEFVQAYYGRPQRWAYFESCSKGGQQGLREAEQYPQDFDGIVAGAPALDFSGVMLSMNWNARQQLAGPGEYTIPAGKLPAIHAAVLARCDRIDGLSDGLIDDPRRCRFDPGSIACLAGGDDAACLTAPQVGALRSIYRGPTTPAGQPVSPGLSVGSESPDLSIFGWTAWLNNLPGLPSLAWLTQQQYFAFLGFGSDDPDYDWTTVDYGRDLPRMQPMRRILNADVPDLRAYARRGGKLLMWHGWSDPVVPPQRSIDFYSDVERSLGPTTRATARLFMVPGLLHCYDGPGPNTFDALSALEQWVEDSAAPRSIIATHYDENGTPDRTRPLCPYPQVARWTGQGSSDDAGNFECVDR